MYFISLFVRITLKPVSDKISFLNIFTSNVSNGYAAEFIIPNGESL